MLDKPKKKEPKKAQTAEEMKESMEEKGLAKKIPDEEVEETIKEIFDLNNPTEKFEIPYTLKPKTKELIKKFKEIQTSGQLTLFA